MKTAIKFLLFIAMTGSMFTAFAQDTQTQYKPSNVYNVRFVVSELDNGKVTNQRVYIAVVREDRKGVLKTGSRVPVVTGSKSSDAPMQWQYLDVGFDVDFMVSEREGRLDLDLSADLSSMAPPDPNSPTPGGNPVVRQVREAMNTTLVEGKPTVVASLDDVNSKKTVQLEVTITRIKKS